MKTQASYLDASGAKALLESVDTFLFDCDGVLWHGANVIKDAEAVVNKLQQLGKKVFLVTNNSTKTQNEYVSKCAKLGFQCSQSQVVSTSFLTVQYLKSLHFDKKVYLVGSTGLSRELDAAGIRHIGLGPDVMEGNVFDGRLDHIRLDPEVGAVVVGFDSHISFNKILKASSYLKNPDVLFVATNRDERFPMEHLICPGTGTMVASVCVASGREPVVMGKPSQQVFEALRQQHGLDPARTLMVGDNCKTDITMGNLCGLRTMAVLTGVTTAAELQRLRGSERADEAVQVPELVLPAIGDLLPHL
ncbi:glycerol-3-phosphate phosphatase-like [Pollicipes pollicipes]|uniref:glycerol-3-phosphate phosphatase-like n=1 Tax=Pollicipes pollicipes TaxID=41117 RepID=UPI0018854107|nr:glycerol-3-phosphate phosphatase-like [Pollicipes pollicipes]XP_037070393.1 glycerol-3-phosphate phosphatase-like [Pollicipes pollicipes]XP_037070875.1 glycerol-3-phosphate phosphatase-like [Pollicipes pollicipes]